ncbi:DMT family transporter [Methylotuvimicrobium sp.]|uniref:DMT family transporter n=1 Tax=Methylotuvimicrobium sp. TaxID=2822413 RepID=UPI003D656426
MGQLPFLALLAGAAIACQATMNARLGVLLNNPLLASGIAFLFSFLLTAAAVATSTKHYPQIAQIKAVPVYLWFAGSTLSAFGVATFYYLIPKMGVGSMTSFALSGQILVAMIAGHFRWFGLAENPINTLKMVGMATLIVGVYLINWESPHGY